MLELIVLFGVVGVCSVACSLSGQAQSDHHDAQNLDTTIPPQNAETEYKDLLTHIYADELHMPTINNGATFREADITQDVNPDPFDPNNLADTINPPAIINRTLQDQLVIAYSRPFQREISVKNDDSATDLIVSVGRRAVAQDASGPELASDIALMPRRAYA